MNNLTIRLQTKEDAQGKGYVHYQSWIETYQELIPEYYLMRHSLERTTQLAYEHPENTWIALVEDKVVGFSCFVPSRDEDLIDAGEITAIYVLKDYQHQGIGYQLMEKALFSLSSYQVVALWVLSDNEQAIKFYEKQGFTKDGQSKIVMERKAIRMIKDTH